MVEIRERNPKLRIFVNLVLTTILFIFLALNAKTLYVELANIARLNKEIRVLETEQLKKQREYLNANLDFKSRRQWMSSRQAVEASLRVQELSRQLSTAEKKVSERKEAREKAQGKVKGAVYYSVISLIAYCIIMWINYILNY